MAIEIKITKELGNYTPKLIGPLTARNIVCVVVAMAAGFVPYKVLATFIPAATARWIFFPFGILAWLFGFHKPYGYDMTTEQFIQSVFVNKWLAPQKRKYKCKNTMEGLLEVEKELALEEEEELKDRKKELKKPAKKKEKAPKYQRSSQAIK